MGPSAALVFQADEFARSSSSSSSSFANVPAVVSPANFVPVSRCSPFFDVQSLEGDRESENNTISLGTDGEATMSDSTNSSISTAASSNTKSQWRLDLNEIFKDHEIRTRRKQREDFHNSPSNGERTLVIHRIRSSKLSSQSQEGDY